MTSCKSTIITSQTINIFLGVSWQQNWILFIENVLINWSSWCKENCVWNSSVGSSGGGGRNSPIVNNNCCKQQISTEIKFKICWELFVNCWGPWGLILPFSPSFSPKRLPSYTAIGYSVRRLDTKTYPGCWQCVQGVGAAVGRGSRRPGLQHAISLKITLRTIFLTQNRHPKYPLVFKGIRER